MEASQTVKPLPRAHCVRFFTAGLDGFFLGASFAPGKGDIIAFLEKVVVFLQIEL